MEELVELSAPEMAEVLAKLRELGVFDGGLHRVCRNGDLIRFLEGHAPDPEFADDVEAGIHERRARAENWTSAWDR